MTCKECKELRKQNRKLWIALAVTATAATFYYVVSLAHADNLIPINKQAILPPVEYDKPYTGKMTLVRTKSQAEIKALCRIYDPVVLGCSFRTSDSSCLVYIASDADIKWAGWNYDYVFRHEVGHCLGWSKDHRGARYHD